MLQRQDNQGVSGASNAAIAACRGEWVHLLGSDDVLHSTKIERIQQAIADWDCSDLALVHADADMIDRWPADHGMGPCVRVLSQARTVGAWRACFSYRPLHLQSRLWPCAAMPCSLSAALTATLALEDLDCWLRLSTRYSPPGGPGGAGPAPPPTRTSRLAASRMLGAQFHTYGKFLGEHGGLIPEADIRRHFRRYLRRFWRRMRGRQPGLLPLVMGRWLKSHLRTPQPEDYRRFGRLLDGAAG
ncbi:MAG: glycosyltransferase [Rhodocyclaceae bacterium]|nr:glycosyltransferase [Rhodocyclaceae bacterium]